MLALQVSGSDRRVHRKVNGTTLLQGERRLPRCTEIAALLARQFCLGVSAYPEPIAVTTHAELHIASRAMKVSQCVAPPFEAIVL
jgi:hypothetical protein